jgi:hypothetical protein
MAAASSSGQGRVENGIARGRYTVHLVQCRGSVKHHSAVAEHQRGRQDIRGIVFHHKTIGHLKALIASHEKLDVSATA